MAILEQEITRLDELATTANREHEQCFEAAMTMLYHGIAAGEALIEAKSLVKHGEWLTWLKENVSFAETSATSYMMVARHKDYLLSCDNVRTMQTALAALRDGGFTSWGRLTRARAQEVAAYAHEFGVTAAARHFEMNQSTVSRYAAGQLPGPSRERGLHRRGRAPRHARIAITDEMIEALAEWLCQRFQHLGYSQTVDDRVRGDALEALGKVVGPHGDAD